MKLAQRIIVEAFNSSYEEDAVIAFNKKIEELEIENIKVSGITVDDTGGSLVQFVNIDDDEELWIYFSFTSEDGAQAVVVDPESDSEFEDEDNDDIELEIIDLDPYNPKTMVFASGEIGINLIDLDWLDIDTMEDILTMSEIEEQTTFVIRGGKRVKKKLIRKRRKKRLSPKQRQGIRKAKRSRKKTVRKAIRKRKKSLKIRKRARLKRREAGSRLKVQGTAGHLGN